MVQNFRTNLLRVYNNQIYNLIINENIIESRDLCNYNPYRGRRRGGGRRGGEEGGKGEGKGGDGGGGGRGVPPGKLAVNMVVG